MYDECFKYVDLHYYIKSKCFMLQIWLHLSMHSHNADNVNIFRRDHKNIWDQSVSLDNYEIYFSTLPLRTGYSIISATDSVTPILSYHCRVDILMLDSQRLQPDCLLVHSMHRVFIILVRYFIFERQSVKYVIDSGCEDVLVSSRENIYVFRDIISERIKQVYQHYNIAFCNNSIRRRIREGSDDHAGLRHNYFLASRRNHFI